MVRPEDARTARSAGRPTLANRTRQDGDPHRYPVDPGDAVSPAERDDLGPADIAAHTYRRPHDLPEHLPMHVTQALQAARDAAVLVVDNDAAGSAGPVVDEVRASLPEHQRSALHYVVEAVPGIAAA